jgi:hypothetical protein
MSTPLACVSVWSFTRRGPASAKIASASTARRRKTSSRPAAARMSVPRRSTSSPLENVIAASGPIRPRRKA